MFVPHIVLQLNGNEKESVDFVFEIKSKLNTVLKKKKM